MQTANKTGQKLASIAALMYLVNLLLLPGITLGGLIWMRSRYAASSPPLAVYHLRLAINASLIAILIIAGEVPYSGCCFLTAQRASAWCCCTPSPAIRFVFYGEFLSGQSHEREIPE
ncbi:hypothetical protein [Aliamphritea spongicola]|nr:hypothetical protein [Aliamphritea spongicola]